MPTIAIVYFSQSGTADLAAQVIAAAAQAESNIDVDLFRITGSQITNGRWEDRAFLDRISRADTIIFGSPTFMGGPAAQFKAFADATADVWYKRGWKDKLAGGFTISGSPSGDKLYTLTYFSILAAQHGMIWVNSDELSRQADGTNRLGSFVGLMAQNPIPREPIVLDPADALSATKFGRRMATVTARLRSASD